MKNRRVKELFRKERRIEREIRRKMEWYEELVAKATSTGSLRYDQDKVTGSSPDGSRQERIVVKYVELEKEIVELEGELMALITKMEELIGILPAREKEIMTARYLKQKEVEDIMQEFKISYETYKIYHKRAIRRMEQQFDKVPQI